MRFCRGFWALHVRYVEGGVAMSGLIVVRFWFGYCMNGFVWHAMWVCMV